MLKRKMPYSTRPNDSLVHALGGMSAGAGHHNTMNVGLLLQYIENGHPGVVIVITNMKNAIDDAFFDVFALSWTLKCSRCLSERGTVEVFDSLPMSSGFECFIAA